MTQTEKVSHERFREKYDQRLRKTDEELSYSTKMTTHLVELYKQGIIKIALGFDTEKTLDEILSNRYTNITNKLPFSKFVYVQHTS